MQRDLMPVGSFNNSKLKNYFTEQDSQQSVRSKQDTQNSFKITRPFEMDRSSERKFQFDGYQSKPQEKSQNASFEMFQPPHEHVQLENTHVSPMSIDTLYKSPVEAKSYILKSPSNQVPTSKSPQNQTMASKSPQNQPQSVFKFIQQEQQSQPDLNLFISPKNESFDHPQISNPTININSLQQSEKEEKQQFFDFQKEKSRNDQQKGFFGNTYSASEINRSPIQNPLATPSQSLSVIQNDRSFADPSTSMISSKSVALPQVKITPNLQNPFSIEQTQTLKAHDKSVKDLCFMDDDKLISCSRDCSIKIWDKKTYQMKMTLKDHTDQVLCVAFFKKRIIASGSADKTVRIWKPSPHWQMFRVCEGHTERIRCIGFVNQLIASGSDDTTLKLWDFEGELKHSHKTNGRVGALIPERHFVILTSGKNIQIFDTQIMAKKLEKPAHKNLVLCLALLSKSQNDGEGLLISGSKDNCIKLWQYPKLEELKCIEEDYPIQSVCFGPESFIILGLMGFEQEGKISIWKLDTNPKKVQEITVNPYGCNKVLYDSQSEMLYNAHENKRIEFINIKV